MAPCNPYLLTQFVGFVIFMIAVQAELTQTPFDMPIAESELVSVGYMTEYSGFRFLIFFIAEFAAVGVFALIASVLFLGGGAVRSGWFGWRRWSRAAVRRRRDWMNVVGPLIRFTKMIVLSFIVMWVRFSYPRLREDQLQRFAWKASLSPCRCSTSAYHRDLQGDALMATRPEGRSGSFLKGLQITLGELAQTTKPRKMGGGPPRCSIRTRRRHR